MSKPFRIGLVMQGGSGWMGGVEYIKNIVFALASLPIEIKKTFEIVLICSKEIDPALYDSIIPEISDISYVDSLNTFQKISAKLEMFIFSEYNNHFLLIRHLRKSSIRKLDFLYPYFSLRNTDYTGAIWIPDFQHKYLPSFFSKKDIIFRDRYFSYLANNASTIVVSSESAKKDFQKFYPESKSELKILSFTTFPLENWYMENSSNLLLKYNLPSRFLLVSNQFWQHKNHKVIFNAASILKEKGITLNIVCTGNLHDIRNLAYSEQVQKMIKDLGLSEQVYLLGLIPKIDQIQLVRSALAIIQPSLFEGWSTVVEDARCFGKRIALSNIPVHLEQNPPKSKFFDPDKPKDLAEILLQWWNEIQSGYDQEHETIAYGESLSKAQSFGYKFLELAKQLQN